MINTSRIELERFIFIIENKTITCVSLTYEPPKFYRVKHKGIGEIQFNTGHDKNIWVPQCDLLEYDSMHTKSL